MVGGGGDLKGPAGPVKRNFESKFELRWLGIFLPNPNPPLFCCARVHPKQTNKKMPCLLQFYLSQIASPTEIFIYFMLPLITIFLKIRQYVMII